MLLYSLFRDEAEEDFASVRILMSGDLEILVGVNDIVAVTVAAFQSLHLLRLLLDIPENPF